MDRPANIPAILRTGATLLLALAAAGCTVGPDYEKPQASLPQNWTSQGATQEQSTTAVAWWNNFNDPILTQLIEKAMSGNLDLQVAAARIEEARAQQASAANAFLPGGDLSASANRQANRIAFPDASTIGFGPLLLKPFNTYQTGFDASWELDLFGGERRALQAADATLEASEATRDDALVSLMAEVASTYVDIRQYQAQLAITQETIKSDEDTVRIARQRFEAGESPRLDVTQAEAELEQEQAQLPYDTNLLAQTEYSMDVLLGAQPGTAHAIVATTAPIPASDKKLVLAAPAAVIADRPDIRVAERKLAAATAQQGVAVAKFFPDVSLSGFFGLLNTNAGDLIRWGSNSWMGGASVMWPILNYGSLSANLDAANAQQQEAMANYRKTILAALADVERSFTAYTQQEKFREALAKSVADNKRADAVARQRYKEGLTSFLEVLDAERTFYASQSKLAEADAHTSQNVIAVYKSLGGGWQNASDSASASPPPAPSANPS
jgi:NodT family efflux transporter outer membrane factor (OMF) lipoprotein